MYISKKIVFIKMYVFVCFMLVLTHMALYGEFGTAGLVGKLDELNTLGTEFYLLLGTIIFFIILVFVICEILFERKVQKYTERKAMILLGIISLLAANVFMLWNENPGIIFSALFNFLGIITLAQGSAGNSANLRFGSVFIFGNAIFFYCIYYHTDAYWPIGYITAPMWILLISGISFLLKSLRSRR